MTRCSGEAARLKGGHFDPVGMPALDLALTLEGMFIETGHGFGHRIEPLTVRCYPEDVDDIVDLRDDDGRSAAEVPLADMACTWACTWACAWAGKRANGRRPTSWTIARRLEADGAAGILVPSFATGARSDMHNLVLWVWGPTRPHKIEVHDPSGRLPKSQLARP